MCMAKLKKFMILRHHERNNKITFKNIQQATVQLKQFFELLKIVPDILPKPSNL